MRCRRALYTFTAVISVGSLFLLPSAAPPVWFAALWRCGVNERVTLHAEVGADGAAVILQW